MAEENQTLRITREFNASREKVWEAWTDPEQFAKWFSPETFTVPMCEIDAQPGGKLTLEMKGPDGTSYPLSGTYLTVEKPELLKFKSSPTDDQGKPLFEVEHTVEFIDNNGKTTLKLTWEVVSKTAEAEPYLAGMEMGLNQSLDKLGKVLAQ